MRTQRRRVRRLRLPTGRRLVKGLAVLGVVAAIGGSALYVHNNWESLSHQGEEFIARQMGAEVGRILVSGVENTDPKVLSTALAMQKGDSLVGFSVQDAQKRIEDIEWVRKAAVARELPSTIRVEVFEYRPLARLELNDSTWVIDRDGHLITEKTANFDHLPLLRGAGAAENAAKLFKLVVAVPGLTKQLKGATYVGERRWDLHFNSGVTVMLPADDPAKALDVLIKLNEKRQVLSMNVGRVDLRLPDRIVLRIADEEHDSLL